jgi:intron-binding protein aquarius
VQNPAFLAANPGFGYDFQMINVPDYNGRGESEPAPYYYQNLGEAEYIVAVYRWGLGVLLLLSAAPACRKPFRRAQQSILLARSLCQCSNFCLLLLLLLLFLTRSFMRLLGYPASKISILTTYNGQKDLLRDVVEARCANHPLIGRPHKVRHLCHTTVYSVWTCWFALHAADSL